MREAHDIVLRKSDVYAIDFPIAAATRCLALAAIRAALETQADRGKDFLFESVVPH
jgi:hypothetical protein